MAYKEIVLETIPSYGVDIVVRSYTKEVPDSELASAIVRYNKTGKCSHDFVRDEKFWLYDLRSCSVCGAGLGTV